MRHIALVVLSVLAVSTSAFAQSAAEIEKALAAAPRQLREEATVVHWNDDFTYETLKNGTNRLVCYDRSGKYGQRPFSVECTSMANLDRVAQNLKVDSENSERAARRAAYEALERAGNWVEPEFGSVFINMSGDNQAVARIHTTVSVPGATAESLGLPDNGEQGGAWIMNAGSSAAHIMVPGS